MRSPVSDNERININWSFIASSFFAFFISLFVSILHHITYYKPYKVSVLRIHIWEHKNVCFAFRKRCVSYINDRIFCVNKKTIIIGNFFLYIMGKWHKSTHMEEDNINFKCLRLKHKMFHLHFPCILARWHYHRRSIPHMCWKHTSTTRKCSSKMRLLFEAFSIHVLWGVWVLKAAFSRHVSCLTVVFVHYYLSIKW